MMNQETYVKLEDLHKQGWTIKEIAAETGYHPATISKWLRCGPPARRAVSDDARVMTARWAERVEALVAAYPRLLGVSVWRCLRAEGFEGCYSTVTGELRRIRGPRFAAADRVSVPIHTDPGEEAQFDFSNLDAVARRWGWSGPLRCFGMILCWSRHRVWWFCGSEDRNSTFEGMVRFFEAVGGAPAVCRTDRMGALGTSQGSRFVMHPAAVEFAAHHSTRIAACRAGDAKRKGKVERPFRQLRETLIPEIEAEGPRSRSTSSTGAPSCGWTRMCMLWPRAAPAPAPASVSSLSGRSCRLCRRAASTPTTSRRAVCTTSCRS